MTAKVVREEINKKISSINTQTELCDNHITPLLVSVIAPSPVPTIDNSSTNLPIEIRETIMRAIDERVTKYNTEKYYYLGGYKGFAPFINNKLVDIYTKSSLGQKDYMGTYIISINDNIALTILDNSLRNLLLQYVVLLQCYQNIANTRRTRRVERKSQRNIESIFMKGVGNIG